MRAEAAAQICSTSQPLSLMHACCGWKLQAGWLVPRLRGKFGWVRGGFMCRTCVGGPYTAKQTRCFMPCTSGDFSALSPGCRPSSFNLYGACAALLSSSPSLAACPDLPAQPHL